MTEDIGRRVPPHGSGGGEIIRRHDPDETAGRALYRATANAEGRASIGLSRKARLLSSAALTKGEADA